MNRNTPYYQRNKETIREKSKLTMRKKRQDNKTKENERQRKYLANKRATNPEWKASTNKYFRDLMRKRNNIQEDKWRK